MTTRSARPATVTPLTSLRPAKPARKDSRAELIDVAIDIIQAHGIDVGQKQTPAFASQDFRAGEAETTRGTGDERTASGKALRQVESGSGHA